MATKILKQFQFFQRSLSSRLLWQTYGILVVLVLFWLAEVPWLLQRYQTLQQVNTQAQLQQAALATLQQQLKAISPTPSQPQPNLREVVAAQFFPPTHWPDSWKPTGPEIKGFSATSDTVLLAWLEALRQALGTRPAELRRDATGLKTYGNPWLDGFLQPQALQLKLTMATLTQLPPFLEKLPRRFHLTGASLKQLKEQEGVEVTLQLAIPQLRTEVWQNETPLPLALPTASPEKKTPAIAFTGFEARDPFGASRKTEPPPLPLPPLETALPVTTLLTTTSTQFPSTTTTTLVLLEVLHILQVNRSFVAKVRWGGQERRLKVGDQLGEEIVADIQTHRLLLKQPSGQLREVKTKETP